MGERGGQDRERSSSQDSNSGCLYSNDAVCWRAAHKAISADRIFQSEHPDMQLCNSEMLFNTFCN